MLAVAKLGVREKRQGCVWAFLRHKHFYIFRIMTDYKALIEGKYANFRQLFRDGDIAKSVTTTYSNTAKFMAPGAPTSFGQEGITRSFQGLKDNGVKDVKLEPQVCTPFSEKFVLEEGLGALMKTDGSESPFRYIVSWLQEEDGEWRIIYDIFNSSS